MTVRNTTASTWSSRGKPVATWFYEARPPAPQPGARPILEDPVQRARWLGAIVGNVLQGDALAKFERAEVVTQTHGEDAFTVAASETDAVGQLISYLTGCLDFVALSTELSLMIAAPGGGTQPLPFSLTLAVETETDDVHHAPVLSQAYPFQISLTVNTTLFAEATFDGSGDNRLWARTNRHVLEKILRTIGTVPGMTLASWEADGFSGQVRANGFSNLAQEYRISHLGHTADDLHYVARLADGLEVVEISHFDVRGADLYVRYRVLEKVGPAVAAILVLEHFVPEVMSRVNPLVGAIQLEESDSSRIHRFPYPTRNSTSGLDASNTSSLGRDR